MPTFLTNSKMDPALAARIEASVRGRRRKPGERKIAPRVIAIVRIAVVIGIVSVVVSIVSAQRKSRREIETTRATLLEDVRAKSASLTAYDKECLPRAESWLVRFAGAYEADLIADELRAPGALGSILARPSIYVRAPLGALQSASTIAEASAVSAKDPFASCIVEPPRSRAEKVLLQNVRVSYAGGAPLEESTRNVHRLYDAEAGLPFLLPPWSDRVRATGDPFELARLRNELEKAPIERAKETAKATLLLLAIDEPGEEGGPTELDGERAHAVRVGLVDLAASKVLVRLRKRVDPKWISPAMRPTHASGLDGCALALDVREAIEPSAAPTSRAK